MARTTAREIDTTGDAGLQAPVNHRRSRALRVWLAVVVSVLFLLWLETDKGPHRTYNLYLSGDSGLVGSRVVIDGQPAGVMSHAGGTGLGGALFYGKLKNGPHEIEVRRPGFQPFVRKIDMHGEYYTSVDLRPSSD